MPQDGVLQVAQLRTRIESKLLRESPFRRRVRRQRVGLTAGPVERDDELGGEPFAKGVRSHESLQGRDDVAVPAQGELAVHQRFPGVGSELAQPRRSHLGEVRRAQVGEHVPTPEVQRVGKAGPRLVCLAQCECLLAALQPPFEDLGIDVCWIDDQRVRTVPSDQGAVCPRVLQHAASLRDVGPQRDESTIGGGIPPEVVHEAFDCHRLVRVQQQYGEQLARAAATQRHGNTVEVADLQRSQQPEPRTGEEADAHAPQLNVWTAYPVQVTAESSAGAGLNATSTPPQRRPVSVESDSHSTSAVETPRGCTHWQGREPTMTATADLSPLAILKQKQQATWSSGDYNRIAAITVPVAETLVASAAPRPGAFVLDVATGTGHVALAAARQFSQVSAVDYVPALLDVARRRAAAEGLSIDIREGDAERLPFPDSAFDVVYSALGVMFAADHQQAAKELIRVCGPGGRIALASWTPEGFIGRLLKIVGRHVPPPAVAQSPTRWGTPHVVQELLGEDVEHVHFETRTVTQRFLSAEHFADFFLTYYGPTRKAAEQFTGEGRAALRADMVELAVTSDRSMDGTISTDWEYLVAVATKR
jgi:SAM-dependent methyltransferase